MSDNRLTLVQYDRLSDIVEYLSSPRPELDWGGIRRESRHMSKVEWRQRIAYELYIFYREMYPNDEEFTMELMDDFFDDAYVDNLVSFKRRIKEFFCCRRSVNV